MPWRGPSEPGELPTLGLQVLGWIRKNLIVPDGPGAGDPLRLTDEQAQFVMDFYSIDPAFRGPAIRGRALRNGRRIRRAVLSRPKGWGKSPLMAALCLVEALGDVVPDGWDANGEPVGRPWVSLGFKPKVQIVAVSEDQPLALDTAVPTPTGWALLGDLQIGHEVFDDKGQTTLVTRDTPVLLGEPCFSVEFSDGERVTASARHAWSLERKTLHGDRHEWVTVTTEQMSRDLLNSRRERRYRVPSVAWELPEVDLPIDPYLLGVWLGDGTSSDSTIAIDQRDATEVASLIEPLLREYETITWRNLAGTNQGAFRIRNLPGLRQAGPTLRTRLRTLGVLGAKRIPSAYLRAGTAQRRAVLQGLIDSDGHITDKGRVHFTNVNADLVDDVCELLTSLGHVWNRRHDSFAWRVFFTPGDGEPVARLQRKASQQAPFGARRRTTSRYRYVTSVSQVPSVPVRCIGVDTTDHLFLVGRRAVPTHNTTNTWDPCLEMARHGPVRAAYDIEPLETFINVPRGRIEYTTSSFTSREGFRPVFAVFDQTESWVPSNGGGKLAATVRRNLGKVGGSSVETPNAHVPGEGSVAERSFEAWAAQQAGKLRLDDSILYDHREAPPDTDQYDETSLRAGLAVAYGESADVNGGWVPLDRILAEYWDLGTESQDARRFYLNQITSTTDAWITQPEWAGCTDVSKVIADGDVVTLGFDGSRSRSRGVTDATALIGCRVSDGHLFELGVWEQPQGETGRDWAVPVVEVEAAVDAAFQRYTVVGFFADPAKWETRVAAWEAKYHKRLKVKATQQHPIAWWMVGGRSTLIVRALEQFHSAVVDTDLTHDGSWALTRHVLNARREPTRSGFQIRKDHPDSARKIDAAVAAVLAHQARLAAVAAGVGRRREAPRRVR